MTQKKMSLSDLRKKLIGQTIKDVRLSTPQEIEKNYWDNDFEVIELENGATLWGMSDGEGNSEGVLVGELKNGFGFYLRDTIVTDKDRAVSNNL